MLNNMEHITIKTSEGKVFRRIAEGNEITLRYPVHVQGTISLHYRLPLSQRKETRLPEVGSSLGLRGD